jgi:hypothetical protein
MTNEWAGNDLHRSPILGFFRPRFAFGRSMAPSRSRARSASMTLSGTCTGSSLASETRCGGATGIVLGALIILAAVATLLRHRAYTKLPPAVAFLVVIALVVLTS